MEFGTNKRDLFYYTVPFYSISSCSFASLVYWVYFCFSLFHLFLLFTSSFLDFFFLHVFLVITGRIYSYLSLTGLFFLQKRLDF